MPTTDPRIDAYIAKAADFAQPVLKHLRRIVHAADPDVEETMKWSFPHFMHGGMLCSMAAFKQHCTFGFWKGSLFISEAKDDGMGQFGRITSISDLPKESVLAGYIKKAIQLNEAGIKSPTRARSKVKKELVVPPDLRAALKKNKKALATFEGFNYSHKKEYVQWITEAKREETRTKRLATALDWLSAGKSRHWKYANC